MTTKTQATETTTARGTYRVRQQTGGAAGFGSWLVEKRRANGRWSFLGSRATEAEATAVMERMSR